MPIVSHGRGKFVRKGRRRYTRKATVSPAVKRYVKKALDSDNEFKLIDTYAGAQYTYNTGLGNFFLLNGVSQGDGQSSRDGRIITNRSVQLKLLFRAAGLANIRSNVRWILFIDLEPHGVPPVATDLLDTATTSPGLLLASRNLDNRNRFIILKDKTFNLDQFDNAGHVKDTFSGLKYRKLRLKTTFDASNNGDISDIVKGALYVWVFSDNNTGTSYEPLAYIYGRVRFTDS